MFIIYQPVIISPRQDRNTDINITYKYQTSAKYHYRLYVNDFSELITFEGLTIFYSGKKNKMEILELDVYLFISDDKQQNSMIHEKSPTCHINKIIKTSADETIYN